MLRFAVFLAAVFVTNAADPAATGASDAGGATDAKILASKFLLSRYAVEDKEFVVDYRLYNVGDKMATKVTLDDSINFHATYFEIIKGVLSVEWDRIPPGSNVSHSIILKPLFSGSINYTAADISYFPSETATAPRKGYTSSPGEGYVYRLRDYERRFAPRYTDWALFALATTPVLLLPAFLWYSSKSKYEKLAATKEKKQA